MKKYLLLLTSAALLLAGCAKELVSNGVSSRDGELTKVTFTANLDNGVATKAVADGDGAAANVNRCIMEIYYGDALFTRQITKVTDKKATLTAQVVSNRTYKVAFWADHVDDATTPAGLAADKYYITNAEGLGLKAITIKDAYAGNDDARDAFFHCGSYEVKQAGSSFGGEDKILLKRPFAQMNVITTDWDIVSAPVATLAPEQVNVIIKNPLVKFNAVTGEASADANTATLNYTADVYVAPAPVNPVSTTEKTLSMDYLFASTTKEVIDIDWKALHGTDTPVAHAFAAVPYQRNYRTNIKGALLTTQGQWTVTVDSIWGSPEYDVPFLSASTIAEAQSYIAPETQGSQTSKVVDLSKATITTGDITGEDKIEFMLKTTSPADMVNFTLPAIPADVITAGCTGWKITHQTGYPTQNVNVTAPTGTSVTIEAPTSHVTLNGVEYDQVTATTGYGTLVVPKGVTVDKLTVTKGWVEIHGTVNTLHQIAPAAGDSVYFRDCEGLSQEVFNQIKGEGFNFIHPDYVEKENEQNGWDIIPIETPVTSVGLDFSKVELNVGKDTSLTATVLPEDASNKSVVWKSSNTAVATVDTAGKVTAVAAGSAEITVTTVNKSKTATCSVTVKKVIPAGALGGEFSVSANKKVYFSQGNLYWDGSNFNFEANQYDFRTYAGKNSCINGTSSDNDTPTGHWGLFGWVGASSTQFTSSPEIYGVSTSNTSSHYGNVANEALKADWGKAYCEKNNITPDNTWRTLTKDEWTYLCNTRTMTNKKSRYSNAVSGVTIGSATYQGVFLYPDNYNGEVVSSGSMTWDQINAAGIVFLPVAGYRDGSNVDSVGDCGYYWSSTAYGSGQAYYVYFISYSVRPDYNQDRHYGYSVRLITDVK